MYSVLYTLLYIPVGIAVQLVYLSMLESLLQPKYPGKVWKYSAALVYCLCVTFVSTRLPPLYRLILNSTMFLIPPLVLFKGRVMTKLLAYALWMIAYPCSESLAMLAALLWGWQFNVTHPSNQLIFDIVCLLIVWAFYIAVHSIKRVIEERPERSLLLRLAAASIALVLCTFIFVANSMLWVQDEIHPFLTKFLNVLNAVGVFLPFLILRWLISLLQRLNTSMQESEQSRLMQARAERELLQIRALAVKDEQYRRLRHDFKNHLLAIDALAQQDEPDRLRAYISSLSSAAEAATQRAYCGHPVIDGLFETKAMHMRESGIEVTWRTRPAPARLNISDLDLCSLIGNSLDNAIESCQRMPEGAPRRIIVSLDASDRGFFLQITNSCHEAAQVLPHMHTRSQKRLTGPGLGVSSMQRIVDQHNGEMHYKADTPSSITLNIYLPA